MMLFTRRSVLAIAGGGVFASALPVAAAPSIVLPLRPMVLSRDLVRELRDGEKVTVKREWRVRFRKEGRGVSISGKQVGVTVDAPPSLAALAAIEQARSTDAMFPILLSASGEIVAAGRYTQAADLEKAVAVAEEMIARSEAGTLQKSSQLRQIAQLQLAGNSLLEQMPADLFFPRNAPVRAIEPVRLPGGMSGEFELVYEAQPAADGGWLQRAERRIVTRIGAEERKASEIWTLY